MLQQWYWFAVDQDEFEGRTVNTGLFDTHTKQIKQLGVDYVNYVTPLAAPYVDLEAYYLALTPHWPIFLGDPSLVEMDGTVFNRGNRASGAFDVAVKAGSSTLQTWTVSGLTRRFGGNDHASFHYDWQQIINGDQSLSLVVDEADQVTEPCSDNNVYRKTLVAPQITDLALSGLTTVPKILPPLPHGQTATVRLQVNLENLGTQGTAADHIDVKFWLGDPDDGGVLIGSQTLTPGNVGLPAVVGFDWPDVAAGYYDVYAVVDAVPEEANRENNRQYARIIVPEGVAFMPTIDDNRYYRNAIEAESPGTSNPTLTPYWLP
jgi:hypothetical protein